MLTPAERLVAESRRRAESLLVLPALLLSAVTYLPVTRNYFYGDDFLNLYHIADRPLLEYLLTPNGGHTLVARNAVFYVTTQLAGTDPAPYYWSAFLVHLLNVWLLFGVIRVLTGGVRLASFAAALWGISTFHEGTLGWYSVFGHVVVGTVLLIILYQAGRDAAARRPPSRAERLLWYALALVAATSFGTGTGIAIVLPIVVRLFLSPALAGRTIWRSPLASLMMVVPALYVILFVAYERVAETPAVPHNPMALLTAPMDILRYLGHLIALGLTRLLLGPLPAEWATLGVWYAALGVFAVALIAVARRGGPELRRRLAGCLLLLLACYGTVALARALFLANTPLSVLPTLSRYHYTGQLILTIMLCLFLNELSPMLPQRLRTLALVAWYGAVVFASVRFGRPIDHHLPAKQETERVHAAIRQLIEKPPAAGDVYVPNRRFRSVPLPTAMFPGWAAVFVIFYPDNAVGGRRIYFVDPNPNTLGATRHGIRTRTLIVPHPPTLVAPAMPESAP